MKIRQIRNATVILELGEHTFLLDPVFSDAEALPAFRMRAPRLPNPRVGLPEGMEGWLSAVTAVLLTHSHHVDHFDKPGEAWVRESGLTLWGTHLDQPYLRGKNLNVDEIVDGFLGLRAEVLPAQHGTGVFGWLMGPGSGIFLACPGEPSVYFTGDAVLTDELVAAVERLQPDVIVAPAGAANFGIGPDILFSVDQLITLAAHTKGALVFNHLEAIDHCPTTREELRERLASEGLSDRAYVPEDGEQLRFDAQSTAESDVPIHVAPKRKPGIQKWIVDRVAQML